MTVVRLFPPGSKTRATSGDPESSRTAGDAETPPRNRASRPLDPVDVIARSLDGMRSRRGQAASYTRDPARIIAEALDTPMWRKPTVPNRQPPPHPTQHRPTTQQQPIRETRAPESKAPPPTFWSVWMEHNDYLYRQSLRLLGGNRPNAEDALSTAMLRAAHAFAEHDIANHRAWLSRILHNVCMDHHRARRQQPLSEPSDESGAEAVESLSDLARSPEEELIDREMIRLLEQTLAGLSPALVEPLLLFLDDVADPEIADRLGVSRAAVRKRRQIIREKLRLAIQR